MIIPLSHKPCIQVNILLIEKPYEILYKNCYDLLNHEPILF